VAAGLKVYNYDAIDDDWDEVGDSVWVDTFIGGGDMLPHGVAGVIHAKSLDPDVQGAKYIGGIVETQHETAGFVAQAMTAMVDFAQIWTQSFVGSATGGDFVPGVWSVVQTNLRLFSGVEIVNVTAGYQRRRKPGVGI
jgi:hypothetical protein